MVRARHVVEGAAASDAGAVVGGECKSLKTEFLKCLKTQGNEHIACKQLSKAYLECRMDRGLMARASARASTRGEALGSSRVPRPASARRRRHEKHRLQRRPSAGQARARSAPAAPSIEARRPSPRRPLAAQVDTEGERENAGFVAGLHIDERKSILPFRSPSGKGGHG